MTDHFKASFIANSIQVLWSYPLDTLKVWTQNRQTVKPCIKTLYKGVQYPMFIQGGLVSLCFSSFYYQVQNGIPDYIAAGVSGVGLSTIGVPFEYLRIQNQSQRKPLSILSWNSGIFLKYWKPVVCRETPFCMVYMCTQKKLRENGYHPGIAGGIASTSAWVSTYPLDVAKTRVLSGECKNITTALMRKPGFDLGLTYSLLRVSVTGLSFMTVYDYIMKLN